MIEIRSIKISDVEAVVRLNVAVWQSAYKGIIDQDFLDARREGIELVIKKQKDKFNPKSFVALCKGEIVGYAAYGKERSGLEKTCEIYALYILDHMQGKGIGKRLVEQCKRCLVDYDYMHIWALRDNPNKGFYTKLGGKKVNSKFLTIGSQSLETECFEYDLKG